MSINTAKTILGGLLPFASNPVVLTVIGIGAATWAVASLFDDKEVQSDEDSQPGAVPDGYEPLSEPLNQAYSTVAVTVDESSETIETTVEEPSGTDAYGGRQDNCGTLESLNDEDAKKELIRQAMSELGKRSGAARRQKMNSCSDSDSKMNARE